MRTWRNWQTRYFEVVVPQGMQVQVLPCAPTKNDRDRPQNVESLRIREGTLCIPHTAKFQNFSVLRMGQKTPASDHLQLTRPSHKFSAINCRSGPSNCAANASGILHDSPLNFCHRRLRQDPSEISCACKQLSNVCRRNGLMRRILPTSCLLIGFALCLKANPTLSLDIKPARLTVAAPPGTPVAIQQSEDLISWSELVRGVAEEGKFEAAIGSAGSRFFRAVSTESVVKITRGSFDLKINPSLVSRPDGQVWIQAPQTVTVRPGTNFLAADLFDGRLHVLPRRLHDGAIYFARILADATGAIQADLLDAAFPSTAIPKTMAAVAAHQPLSVVLIGDSLTEGAGVADYHDTWPFLVFQPSAPTNTWTLLQDVPQLGVRQLGIGGISAEYGLVATRAGSPVLADDYDLAIVGFGANTELGDAPLVEAIVHALRGAGIEVILQSGEKRLDGKATPFLSDEDLLRSVATNQGCALADTYSYMLETDGTYSTDNIHPSVLGHQVWAGCIRSVLNGLKEDPRPNRPSDALETLASLPESLRPGFPDSTTVQFKPSATTGITAPTLFYNSIGPNLGRIPSATAITVLISGQSATFHADRACAVSLLSECQSTESANVQLEYGNGMPGNSLTVVGSFSPRLTPAAAIGLWSSNLPVDLTITVTDGLLRLSGVSFPFRKQ